MKRHQNWSTIRQVDTPTSETYQELVATAIAPLSKASADRNDQQLTVVVSNLMSEILTTDGLQMVRKNYSGETSLTDWLDIVVRRRVATAKEAPGADYVHLLLEGDTETIEDFLPRGRSWLQKRLFSMVSGTEDRELARSVIDDVLSDLFGRGLIEKYGEKGSFPAWLCTVGANRLRDKLGRKKIETEFPRDESGESIQDTHFPSPTPVEIDETVLAALRDGLTSAFASLPPRQLFLIRLVFLHGIQRQTLAQLLDRHPSNIGKEINGAIETIKTSLHEFMFSVDPDGTLDLYEYVFQSEQFRAALHGKV